MVCHVWIIFSYGPYTVVAVAKFQNSKIPKFQNFGNASINNPVSNYNSLPVPWLSFRVGRLGFSPDSLLPAIFIENKMKMEPKQPLGCSL